MKNKPVIATTLSGLFVSKVPWNKAHILWFEKVSKRLNDPLVKNYAFSDNYFKHVDSIMLRLYPDLSDKKRTHLARKEYFDSVIEYIRINPKNSINNLYVDFFQSLKNKYQIALITTNTKEALEEILEATNLKDFFDIIQYSLEFEKDDKRKVFDRFVKKYGKPVIYIGGDRKDSFDYCIENHIDAIFANLDKGEEIENVKSIHNLEELKEIFSKYNKV